MREPVTEAITEKIKDIMQIDRNMLHITLPRR